MSDSRLRDLERGFRETGSSESELLWLQERLRTGDLGQEQAELAAYCGHDALRLVVGDQAAPLGYRRWARGLSRWPSACQLACALAVRFVGDWHGSELAGLPAEVGAAIHISEASLSGFRSWSTEHLCEVSRDLLEVVHRSTEPAVKACGWTAYYAVICLLCEQGGQRGHCAEESVRSVKRAAGVSGVAELRATIALAAIAGVPDSSR